MSFVAIASWVRANIIPTLIIVALLAAAGWFGWQQWQRARVAHTETKLATGQAGASIASGTDAVATVGNRQAQDAAGDRTVQETNDAINNATDAGSVTDAGRSGLCGLSGYRGKPECVRQPAAR